jgi:hypothetical protein
MSEETGTALQFKAAGSPREPAAAVLLALTDRYPKTRYIVTNVMKVCEMPPTDTWLGRHA